MGITKPKPNDIEIALATVNSTLAGLKRVYANPDLFPDRFTRIVAENLRMNLERMCDMYLLSKTNDTFTIDSILNPPIDRLLYNSQIRSMLITMALFISELLDTDGVDAGIVTELKDIVEFCRSSPVLGGIIWV